MAEEQSNTNVSETTEVQDRGLLDFLGKKKEEKPQEEVITTEMENLKVSEPEVKPVEEEKKPSLLEKLHRSDSSSSSSSSEEEVEEDGEEIKRKKKKGLKEKIKEKISGEEEKKVEETTNTSIPIEKCEADDVTVVAHDGVVNHPEEKKSFMEKIKEKLPGGTKKVEESSPVPVEAQAHPSVAEVHAAEAEPKEKKGIFEKIKEKIPGYNKTEDEKKDIPTAAEN